MPQERAKLKKRLGAMLGQCQKNSPSSSDGWEKTFRDLSKPVGAQDPAQAAKFQERYDSYEDAGMGAKPFHYGSHYSSAGIVLHYLLRLEPYTSEHIQLQVRPARVVVVGASARRPNGNERENEKKTTTNW